jgi:Uma2 family endonuclease
MIEAGVLGENDRVELLDGWIICKMTHNPPHDGTIQLVHEETGPHLPAGWVIRIQSAITLGKAEPEPDLAVVRGPSRRYLKRHPVPRDIGCLIEVAETSLDEDRHYKGPIYARALLPIYWVVNIPEMQIEVYTEPRGGRKPGYARRQDFPAADKIPLVLDRREVTRIPVRNMLP